MGVATKGFVITACKDVLFVAYRVEAALTRMLWTELPKNLPIGQRFKAQSVEVTCSPSTDSLTFSFTYQEEQRRLTVFFRCDSDHVQYGPSSLSLRLGCWGASEFIMRHVLRAISALGTCYLNANDAASEEYVELPERLSYKDAVAEGLEPGHPSGFGRWYRTWMRGDMSMGHGDADTVFGIPEAEVHRLMAIEDYHAQDEVLKITFPKLLNL